MSKNVTQSHDEWMMVTGPQAVRQLAGGLHSTGGPPAGLAAPLYFTFLRLCAQWSLTAQPLLTVSCICHMRPRTSTVRTGLFWCWAAAAGARLLTLAFSRRWGWMWLNSLTLMTNSGSWRGLWKQHEDHEEKSLKAGPTCIRIIFCTKLFSRIFFPPKISGKLK